MAKQYIFRINAQQADFSDPQIVSIIYGGSKSVYYCEAFTGTLAEARAELQRVADMMEKPCRVFLGMVGGQRKPPGFDSGIRHVDHIGDGK